MSYLELATAQLGRISDAHRLRKLEPDVPQAAVNFASNDYLAMATEPRVVEALRRAKRVGSGGARLLGGRSREHWLLEEELAAFVGRERALLFSSGYLAALGGIAALALTVDAAYSDELNHASLIDGLRTSHLVRNVYPHRDLPPKSGRANRALIVTESLFSMEGDRAPLDAMLADLNEGDVLLVDEAHAIGVAGREGRGLAHHLQDKRVVVMGTLSKALGSQGGFIAGPAPVIELMVNTARTFIFDTAPAPPLALAARLALLLVRTADDRRARIERNIRVLREAVAAAGLESPDVAGPILPVLVGDETRTKVLENALLEQMIYAPAVRPPTVPAGTSRLRLSVRSDHTEDQVLRFAHALAACTATL
ncbi:MAG: 8-amino-7-oxononanoate synthase [Candidatus Meridianibacter frigidus]|nr:MAG: 8-amino-7-oxononanoate synthase [Candidatus Eremiobacteraeota bacterium]